MRQLFTLGKRRITLALLAAAGILYLLVLVRQDPTWLLRAPGASITGPIPGIESIIDATESGPILSNETIRTSLRAMFDPSALTDKTRLDCPPLNVQRYEALKSSITNDGKINFFFALDLRNIKDLLPRLIGSIIEAVRFLGPENCFISIVEGKSPDGTGDILNALTPIFHGMGAQYLYQSSNIDAKVGDRIFQLAELRNIALQPLQDDKFEHISQDATVLFLNDVAICTEDILELALQRQILGADMTCAMDWVNAKEDNPSFYDVWVARGITGESFFYISPDANWEQAWNLFWNDPTSQERYQAKQPFQVYACWNGAVSFPAKPIVEGLEFRTARGGECYQGEPTLFCKDLWVKGMGKIAVIPSVNLDYSIKNGRLIKEKRGYVSENIVGHTFETDAIEWQLEPPPKVKCIPDWANQFWQEWNLGT